MRWYQRFFRRKLTEKHLDAELRFHLEHRIADLVAAGMAPEEARHRARLEFGGLDQVKEECRDVGAAHFLETLAQDVRYGLRQLRRSPGFTTAAVFTLALGIGANTAVFTVVNGVLLRPLPFVQPERLFLISYNLGLGFSGPGLEDAHYLEFQRRTRAFERVTTFDEDQVTLTGAGDAVSLHAAMVTSSFFPVLGVSPAMGRTFASQEEQSGSPGVAVLGEELWRSRFAADPNILGKAITVNGVKRTVIGVMPAGFAFPDDAALWFPLAVGADFRYFRTAFGRLQPSVSQRQAQA